MDFTWYLNRQGPRGNKGETGEKGNDGSTPVFQTGVNTGTTYTLLITSGDQTFETQNLKPQFVYQNGTYLRYDMENDRYVSAPADIATNHSYGEVKVADLNSGDIEDSDVVTYGLLEDYVADHIPEGGGSPVKRKYISENSTNVYLNNGAVFVLDDDVRSSTVVDLYPSTPFEEVWLQDNMMYSTVFENTGFFTFLLKDGRSLPNHFSMYYTITKVV